MSKVILSNGRYSIVGRSATIQDDLPVDIYNLEYTKDEGFSLVPTKLGEIRERLFGPIYDRVSKIFTLLETTERSVGAIMSGPRGVGKTITARMVIELGLKRDMPAIIISTNYPNIPKFLMSITQPIVVLFDEFEKIFPVGSTTTNRRNYNQLDPTMTRNVEYTSQQEMLSMFDGLTSEYSRIWLITCNKVELLDENLLNRPGRFHYHFRFDYLTANDITAYLTAVLPEQYRGEIDSVVQFAESACGMNYDCLRAISAELSQGRKFDECINDLNIIPVGVLQISMECLFVNGVSSTPATTYIPSQQFYNRNKTGILDFNVAIGAERLGRISIRVADLKWKPGIKKYVVTGDDLPNFRPYNKEYLDAQWKLDTIYAKVIREDNTRRFGSLSISDYKSEEE